VRQSEIARAAGAHETIDYTRQDFEAEIAAHERPRRRRV
jgi:hypothetical protein